MRFYTLYFVNRQWKYTHSTLCQVVIPCHLLFKQECVCLQHTPEVNVLGHLYDFGEVYLSNSSRSPCATILSRNVQKDMTLQLSVDHTISR